MTPPPPYRVVSATPHYPHLDVTFADGAAHTFDLSHLIERPGVWAALRDPAVFARVTVEHGAPTWPNGADIGPDALHAAARGIGEL